MQKELHVIAFFRAAVVLLVMSLTSAIGHARGAGDRPNVVVIFLDDSGYGDYAHNGNPTIRTPNISRLVQDGMNFTQFYVTSPACSASRYSLLTGRYPGRSGLGSWVIGPGAQRHIHPNEITLAEGLKARGYQTGIFGKWHLGSPNSRNSLSLETLPLEENSFNSTVVSETARTLVIANGLIVLPDAPEEYAKKADLFEFIREMPATWDESRVIHSKIGAYITTARRSGEEWFVGSVMNERGGSLQIPLTFLEEGRTYEVTYYEDAAETHYITNRESYQIHKGEVSSEDVIEARIAPGGGHCMWIRSEK